MMGGEMRSNCSCSYIWLRFELFARDLLSWIMGESMRLLQLRKTVH